MFVPCSAYGFILARLIEAPLLASLDETMQSISSDNARDDSPLVTRVRTLRTKVRALCKQVDMGGCILPAIFIIYLSTSLLEIPWAAVVATFLGEGTLLIFHPVALSIIFPFRRTSVHPSANSHAVTKSRSLSPSVVTKQGDPRTGRTTQPG
jgi:hypothetical protein